MPPIRVPPSPRVLLEQLGDGRPLPAELADLEAWLAASSRLRAFVDANRDKIRKKVRLAATTDARLDLLAELRVAARLLTDRRFELAFEAYGAGNRGPDFTAAFRGGAPLNVEVTRRHGDAADGLERTILGKLRQLPPSRANVLVVAVDGAGAPPDPGATLRELRARADRHEDAFFAARGWTGASTFNQAVLRLGAVLAWSAPADGSPTVVAWVHAMARIRVPPAALRAVVAALQANNT